MFDIQIQDVAPPSEVERLHPVDAEDELLAILRRIDRLQAQAAQTLAKVNDAGRWRRRGYTSATAFLKHRAGFSASRGMRFVYMANALENMPLATAAFEAGELSMEHAEALCDAYTFDAEAYLAEETTLVDFGRQMPFVDEFYRMISYWKQRVDSTSVEIEKDMVASLRGVKIRRDGVVGKVYVTLTDEELDRFVAMLDPGPPVPEDRRSLAQRRADRLMELSGARMDKPEVIVHVGMAPHVDPELSETDLGTVLTTAAMDRITCDCTVSRVVFGPEGQPIDVGRRYRLFTAPMRRAISARDRHCRFPGCDRQPQWCDIHHIVHWRRGGTTCVENGILLCRFHHTLVHDAGWSVGGDSMSPTFRDDLGRVYSGLRSRPPPMVLRA